MSVVVGSPGAGTEAVHLVHVLGPLLRKNGLRKEQCAQCCSQSYDTHVIHLSVPTNQWNSLETTAGFYSSK